MVRRLPTAPQFPTGALCPPPPHSEDPPSREDGTHLLALVLLVAEEPVRLWGDGKGVTDRRGAVGAWRSRGPPSPMPGVWVSPLLQPHRCPPTHPPMPLTCWMRVSTIL